MFRRLLRPPHLQTLLLITGVVLAVSLGTLAWRVITQDQAIERQRRIDDLTRAAQAAEGAILRLRARIDDRLALASSRSNTGAEPRGLTIDPGSVTVVAEGDVMSATPPDALLYYPVLPPARRPFDRRIAEGERSEFQHHDLSGAARVYRQVAASIEPAIRANALARLARVSRKRGDLEAALTAYDALRACGDVAVEGLPADLVARAARVEVFREAGRHADSDGERAALAADLEAAKWRLSRATFEFYRDVAGAALSSDRATFAGLLDEMWRQWQQTDRDPSFKRTMAVPSPSGAVIATAVAAERRFAVFIANQAWLAGALSDDIGVLTDEVLAVTITDGNGTRLIGPVVRSELPKSARVVASLGWIVEAHQITAPAGHTGSLLLWSVVVAIALAAFASYAIGRSVVRELAVARLQSDFVAAVSHEFRTPLASLRQLSELLADGRVVDADRRQQYYERMQHETERLQRLVEDLLDFNRMEAGVPSYTFEAIDAAEFVRGAAAEFRSAAESGDHSVSVEIAPGRFDVMADRTSLSRALRNLLDNALKYSPAGTDIRVTLSAENGDVKLAVTDNGVGIPVDRQKDIFKKFVRATTNARVRGTGLGLTMALGIVRAHGGAITVSSTVNQGSTFTIVLPAAAPLAVGMVSESQAS